MFTYRAERETADAAAKGLFGGEETVRARLDAPNKSDFLLKKSLARQSKPSYYDRHKKEQEVKKTRQEPAKDQGYFISL